MCMFVHNRVFKCTHRIKDSSVKRVFADFAVEMFCVDYVESGNPQKVPFVLQTIEEQMEMLRGSEPPSLFIQVIQ